MMMSISSRLSKSMPVRVFLMLSTYPFVVCRFLCESAGLLSPAGLSGSAAVSLDRQAHRDGSGRDP